MKGQHSCELLDEDRFAAPDDFLEEQGYEYYDISREYEKAVRYYKFEDSLSYKEGLSNLNRPLTGVENTDPSYAIQAALSNSVSKNNIVSGSVTFSHATTQCSFRRIDVTTITTKCIQKIRKKW